MSEDLRERILAEALPQIPKTGISEATLQAAGAKAGIESAELKAAFPNGPASLAEAFSHWADARMEERVRGTQPERLRDRVSNAVRARIEVLVLHKEAARRASAFLALPQNAPLAAKLMMRSVDRMWRAAGDRASDFSYYTKRALLSGVYAATYVYWLSDSSEGYAETWTFLEHRIDNVMQIEKFRGQAREAMAKLPNPLDILNSLRGGRR